MSTLSVNIEQACNIPADFIGPPTKTSMDVDVAESVSSQPELIKSSLVQVDCSETDVSVSGNESSDKNSVIGDLIKKFGSLSSMVRVAGVAAMVLSMCLFLLDGMGVVNDTQRFFTMLMLTGLLSAGGFALAFLLKEQRGARAFFGLALLSVPVNFAVLGALFYSVYQLDSLSTAYPTVAHWKIASIASLGSATLIAAVALIPVTIIGISVIGKEGRAWLSGALLLSSSMLLLPIRDTSFIAPIVAVLVIALIGLVKIYGEGIISLKTPAGRFVQSLLFLSPAIMLFRSFWLYDVSSLSALVIALTVYAALRYTGQRIKPEGVVSNSLHVVSAVVALVAAMLAIDVVFGFTEKYFEALIFCIVFGGLTFELEHRVKSAKMARTLGVGTSVVMAFFILIHQQYYDDIIVLLGGLLLSIALVAIGITQKRKEKMLVGGLTLASVLLLNAGGLADLFVDAGWLGFASLGAIAIVAASLLERYGAMFGMQVRRWLVPS